MKENAITSPCGLTKARKFVLARSWLKVLVASVALFAVLQVTFFEDATWEFLERFASDYDDANGCELTPDDYLAWDDLTPQKQLIYKSRHYTKEIWDDPHRDKCAPPKLFASSKDWKPLKINMAIPPVQAVNISVMEKMDIPIRIFDLSGADSSDEKESYEVIARMTLKKYIKKYVKPGNTKYYMLLEDRMHEKKNIEQIVGTNIVGHMQPAIQTNAELLEGGQWNPVWSDLPPENYNWAMFLGGKGTQTAIHLDTDVFNFLYVVEGKKRVVVVPNDELNQGLFGDKLVWSKTGGEGGVVYDLLDKSKPLPDRAIEVELSAGQGLSIPYLAWHAVENLEPTLAYTLRVLD